MRLDPCANSANKHEVAGLSGERDMKIDVMHALEDFLDAYDNKAEMVVTEAIANAIDVKASKISIDLKVGLDDKRTVSFYNNGPPMTEKQFKDYHVIARSSKSKGASIGFAGIGAKVYLAAWDKAAIRTETGNGKTARASQMYVKKRTLKWREAEPKLEKSGTLYRVTLHPKDYEYLERSAEYLISDVFDPALAKGLKIRVGGKRVESWNPARELSRTFKVSVNGKRFQVVLSVTKQDVPARKKHVQYHVSGKVIYTRKPEWMPEVKPGYSDRIHAYVDATAVSDKLNLTKTGFKAGARVAFKDIESRIYKVLEAEGCIGDDIAKKFQKTQLTRFFEKLFKDPKYEFLNPNAIGGRGPGSGQGSGGKGAADKTLNGGSGSGSGNGKNKRGGGSFEIVFVNKPEDAREGWLDPSTNKVAMNIDHPLFIKYENNMPARNQRIATILTSVLIKNASAKKNMDAKEALTLQNELLTLAKDATW